MDLLIAIVITTRSICIYDIEMTAQGQEGRLFISTGGDPPIFIKAQGLLIMSKKHDNACQRRVRHDAGSLNKQVLICDRKSDKGPTSNATRSS
jgi:hypothetical protein